MFKIESIAKALLVALALVGVTTVATAATPEAESGNAWYYKHTGGVPPQ